MKKLLLTIALSLFFSLPVMMAQLSQDFIETEKQQQKSTETKLKAAYIWNLGSVFKFPTLNQQEEFIIGIAGDVPQLFKYLKYVQYSRNTIQGKNVVVKKFQPNATHQDYHILYIAESNPTKVASIMEWVQDKPILTIGDNSTPVFSVGLQLCVSDNKLKMQLDQDLIAAQGIGLKSRFVHGIFESCSVD